MATFTGGHDHEQNFMFCCLAILFIQDTPICPMRTHRDASLHQEWRYSTIENVADMARGIPDRSTDVNLVGFLALNADIQSGRRVLNLNALQIIVNDRSFAVLD